MGRIAGPLTKHRYADLWKQEVKARRLASERRLALPLRPLVMPPASRRRFALLWLIADSPESRIVVGSQFCPPLTHGMRWLLQHDFLRLHRARIAGQTRQTVLCVTDTGIAVLSAAPPRESDIRWIEAACAHDILP
jgi:hypothetical protein